MAKNTHRDSESELTIPSTPKITYQWNLKDHYYKSAADPQIETDATAYELAVKKFVKKYKNKNFTKDATTLAKALRDYESLCGNQLAAKVIRYFSFRTTLDVNDTEAAKKLAVYSERLRKVGDDTIFFTLTIGKIAKKHQKALLADSRLQPYGYFLKKLFTAAAHNLSEDEEKILSRVNATASEMWADATEKILGNRTITFRGQEYSVPEALESIDIQTPKNKQKLWTLIQTELISVSEFAEHELTAITTHAKTSDDLRGYEKPYSETVLGYENTESSVEALVEAISTKGFSLSKRFYRLKAKAHDVEKIPYINKYDPVGKIKQPDFDQAVELCREAFYSVKNEYGEVFDRLISNGQVDVFPKKGKRGGAFMSGTIGLPTYVMLNHTDSFKSLETLAHEMGHAVHAEMSKVQTPFYEGFSTTTAETASTLFEQLVQQKLFEKLDDRDRYVFLHDKITRDIATIQRQIACFNFELAMHELVRNQGVATKEELANLMTKHLRSYLGPAVDVTEQDGYSFVYWPHIRYGFYVYTYTYGILMSNLMARRYEADTSYVEKIDRFLKAGCSDTVENIFKAIDIRADKIDTFMESLRNQEEDIATFAALSKRFR